MPAHAAADELTELRGGIRSSVINSLPPSSGTSRSRLVHAESAPVIRYLSGQAWISADISLQRQLDALRAAYLKLLDPVWGGVYREVDASADRRTIDPQKRLSSQAAALTVFAGAYQATREQRYANAINAVDEYLQEWLAVGDGSFFIAQLTKPERLPEHVSVQRYWSLRSEHERRRFGIPGVEEAAPTSTNAQLISGYVRAFEATGEAVYLRVAMRLATLLLETRTEPQGWLRESSAAAAASVNPRTQALMGLALLDLFQATADQRWLETGVVLAQTMKHAELAATADLPALSASAEYFARLARVTGQSQWHSAGREFLGSASERVDDIASITVLAELGDTIESYSSGYVELLIAGETGTDPWRQLHAGALRVYQPRKLVMPDPRQQNPASSQAALYVCIPAGCQPPVFEVVDLAAVLNNITPASP